MPAPFNKFVFYGFTADFADGWLPGPPAPVEPFFIKIYTYGQEWTQPPEPDPGLLLTSTGTYTVRLYDDYGDGWNGGLLDVYLNGTLVLNDCTMTGGAGPVDYTFPATAGDYLITVYTAGNWAYENWYQILDPALAVIAQDGDDTQTAPPTGIGYLAEPPLLAPSTGTHTVRLYDSWGDSWNGGLLDVYVNNVQVLDNCTVASGAGPVDYTFPANAGDVIATVYTPGSYPSENWYEILDPENNVIAQDGDNTQTVVPTGIGFVSVLVVSEPDWDNPVYAWTLNAATTEVGLAWDPWYTYKFEVELPIDVGMADGWISAQIDAPNGSGKYFLWQESETGDDVCYQYQPPGKGNPLLAMVSPLGAPKVQLPIDMGFELWNDGGTVPVELSSFTAALTAGDDVSLCWVTQSETNVQGYRILRNTADHAESATLISPLIDGTNTPEQHSYSFTDAEIFEPGTYYYWLQNVDFGGDEQLHGPVSVNFDHTPGEITPEIPAVTQLSDIYPNPFHLHAVVPFSLKESARVQIRIYNTRGQLLRHFDLAEKAAGAYQIDWDGKDINGHDCGSGIYHFVMQAGAQTFQRKAVLLK